MTLERAVSVTTFTADNQVTTTVDPQTLIDAERGYRTIPTTPKSSVGRSSARRDTPPNGIHPLKHKAVSEQTFLTSCSSNLSKTAWPSDDFDARHFSPLKNGKLKTTSNKDDRLFHSYLPNNSSGGGGRPQSSKSRQYKKRPENRRSLCSNGEAAALDFHSVPAASCQSLGDAASAKQSYDSKSLPYGSKTAPAAPLDSPQPTQACAFSYIFRRTRKSRSRHREGASVDRDNRHPSRRGGCGSAGGRESARPRVVSTSSSSFQLPNSDRRARNSNNLETQDGPTSASRQRSDSKEPCLPPNGAAAKARHDAAALDATDHRRPQEHSSYQKPKRAALYHPCHTPVPRDRSEDAFYRNPHSDKDQSRKSAADRKGRGDNDKTRSKSADSQTRDSSSRSGPASGSKDHKEHKKPSDIHARSRSQHSAGRVDSDDEHYPYPYSEAYCRNPTTKGRTNSIPVPGPRGFGIYNPRADTKVITDAEDFDFRPTDMKGPLSLTFCGCGFLGMYHLGVATCLVQRAPTFLDRIHKVGGASAGALMGAVLITCPDQMEESGVLIQNLSKEIRSKPLGALTPGYAFTRSMRNMLDGILPEDAHQQARGKLYVSLTDAASKKNVLMTDFKTRDELIEALIASSHIPVYAGMKYPTIRGKKYMDGGLSDNMPQFEAGRTITVSPFDGKSDIGPKPGQEADKKAHFINWHNQDLQISMRNFRRGAHVFFPPRRHVLQEYFEKGRYDASRFLIREGLYEISVPDQSKKVVYESSV